MSLPFNTTQVNFQNLSTKNEDSKNKSKATKKNNHKFKNSKTFKTNMILRSQERASSRQLVLESEKKSSDFPVEKDDVLNDILLLESQFGENKSNMTIPQEAEKVRKISVNIKTNKLS